MTYPLNQFLSSHIMLNRFEKALASQKSGVRVSPVGGGIFLSRFFVYFFINGKSKSPAA